MRPAVNGTDHSRATLIVTGATLAYLAFHLIGKRFRDRWAPWRRRLLGALLLGVVPLVAVTIAWGEPLATWGLTFKDAGWSLAVAGIGWLVVLPVLALQSRRPPFRVQYPELREPFTPRIALINAGVWLAYLIGYELFFRGILLHGLAGVVDTWLALAVVTMAYVFVHLDKYAGEAIGSIVSGAAFGLATLYSGSILMPLVLHVAIAVTSDMLAARRRASLDA